MPLKNKHARDNLRVRNYESGHMVYLDDKSRAAMKVDLAKFYEEAAGVHEEAGGLHRAAAAAQRAAKGPRHISYSPYTRRVGRTPY